MAFPSDSKIPPLNLVYISYDSIHLFSNATTAHNAIGLPQPSANQTSKKRDPDTLTWIEAMADTVHVEYWKAAATKEIKQFGSKRCCAKSSAETEIIPVFSAFRRKELTDGQCRKFKARFCVRGDLRSDDFDTLAPFIS